MTRNNSDAIEWTDNGPILTLADGRRVLARIEAHDGNEFEFEKESVQQTYEYGTYKVTSDYHHVDLIFTDK